MPQISTFSAYEEEIYLGETTELSWYVTDASVIVINNDIGNVPLEGSTFISPNETTKYVITAANKDGTVTANVTVKVRKVPQIEEKPIINFTASRKVVTYGESIILSWEVKNAYTQTLRIGQDEPFWVEAFVSEYEDAPEVTTQYILTATNDVGAIQKFITVIYSELQIVSFTGPSQINKRDTATLEWEVEGLGNIEVVIDPINLTFPRTGTYNVSPDETTEYILIAKNSHGLEARETLTVEVLDSGEPLPPEPPVINFYADYTTIYQGDEVTLNWEVTNADDVTLQIGDEDPYYVDAIDFLIDNPLTTTTYILSASYDDGLFVYDEIKITVLPPPLNLPTINYFTASTTTIREGESLSLNWDVSDATSVEIDNGVGLKPLSGSTVVEPTVTTAFKLTASNDDGFVDKTVTITVNPPIERQLVLTGSLEIEGYNIPLSPKYYDLAYATDTTGKIEFEICYDGVEFRINADLRITSRGDIEIDGTVSLYTGTTCKLKVYLRDSDGFKFLVRIFRPQIHFQTTLSDFGRVDLHVDLYFNNNPKV